MASVNHTKIPTDLEERLQEAIRCEDVKANIMPNEEVSLTQKVDEDTYRKDSTNVKPIQLLSDPTLRIYTIVMFSNWALVTLGM